MRIKLALTALIGIVFVGCLAPASTPAPSAGNAHYRERWFIDRGHHRWRDHDRWHDHHRGRDRDRHDHHRHGRDHEHRHRGH